ASGAPAGGEFRVNAYTTNTQCCGGVASNSAGGFVVVWQSAAEDSSSFGIFAQRFSSAGAPLGPEFRVNTYTTGNQYQPSVASDSAGDFVVVWKSFGQGGGANSDVF